MRTSNGLILNNDREYNLLVRYISFVKKMAVGVEYKLTAVIILGILIYNVETVGTVRLCGRELADAVALVCGSRGYNQAFKPFIEHRGGRYKRGIVDECCKRGCTLKTLESYCSDSPPLKKDTLQISKRSELSSSEIITTPLARGFGERELKNYVRSSKLEKIKLSKSYTRRYQTAHQKNQTANIDMNLLKSSKNFEIKKKQENPQYDEVKIYGYKSENIPFDTSSDIMAEVVESSPESTVRRKRSFLAKLTGV